MQLYRAVQLIPGTNLEKKIDFFLQCHYFVCVGHLETERDIRTRILFI